MSSWPGGYENSVNNCPVIGLVSEYPTPPTLEFIDEVLAAQQAASVGEFGDVILSGDVFADRMALRSRIRDYQLPPDATAREIVEEIADCLWNRYMGICNASLSCDGDEFMRSRIGAINVQSI